MSDLFQRSYPPGVPMPGTVVAGKYTVEGLLGIGGMGVVVAARHIQLGQRVAIKFIRSEGARDPNAVQRFLCEARTPVALSSDHVTRVLDVGTLANGAPYMVMEYLAGVDLGHLLRRDGPMAIPLAVHAVLQACEAVAEAHSLGFVHRDLKPANLFSVERADGALFIKVLDFGVSKSVRMNDAEGAPNLTGSGMLLGSPAYMSPEQVRSSRDVDARTDIWSLGVILYELLTGFSPFTGETLGDTFARIVSESPSPIREHRPDVPPALAATIHKCLERKPLARIQTVIELAANLASFGPPESARLLEQLRRRPAGPVGTPGIQRTLAAPGQIQKGGARIHHPFRAG